MPFWSQVPRVYSFRSPWRAPHDRSANPSANPNANPRVANPSVDPSADGIASEDADLPRRPPAGSVYDYGEVQCSHDYRSGALINWHWLPQVELHKDIKPLLSHSTNSHRIFYYLFADDSDKVQG
eukprot:8855410-Pyramimonas_sp.AAC.2